MQNAALRFTGITFDGFPLSHFPLFYSSYQLAAVAGLLPGFFEFKNFPGKKYLPWTSKGSKGKFSSEFLTKILRRFGAYLCKCTRLHHFWMPRFQILELTNDFKYYCFNLMLNFCKALLITSRKKANFFNAFKVYLTVSLLTVWMVFALLFSILKNINEKQAGSCYFWLADSRSREGKKGNCFICVSCWMLSNIVAIGVWVHCIF